MSFCTLFNGLSDMGDVFTGSRNRIAAAEDERCARKRNRYQSHNLHAFAHANVPLRQFEWRLNVLNPSHDHQDEHDDQN